MVLRGRGCGRACIYFLTVASSDISSSKRNRRIYILLSTGVVKQQSRRDADSLRCDDDGRVKSRGLTNRPIWSLPPTLPLKVSGRASLFYDYSYSTGPT